MLQRSYYRDVDVPTNNYNENMKDKSADASCACPSLDPATGKINNLQLWRVGWVETPGRRNCLNVHEMQYTHMFEKLLSSQEDESSSSQPLYFGHLYLPGGSTSAKSGEERYRLKTWREEWNDETRFTDYMKVSTRVAPEIATLSIDRSAVIGCLMQILDYRRMEDGRLMIFVQALERFVVEEVVDTVPYAVANVQILLDKEELPWEKVVVGKNSVKDYDENFCKHQRGKTVDACFYYHTYEFDRPRLPVSDKNEKGDEKYLTKEDVPWVEISHLLPFAHYSTSDESCLDVANEKLARTHDASNDTEGGFAGGELSLEQQLWNGGILWEPPRLSSAVNRRSRKDATDLSCDTLETLLWLALDDFCSATGFVLPLEVRCLLPPEMDYLNIKSETYLSSNYPKLRRQRRLSYMAPELIENIELPMKGMRQVWLNTPSTAQRLLSVLERYEYLNNKLMGFE
ncbi:hypothetical protein ACHAWU_006583 [Discostella pseudostelligera]|uniref:Lon N-terminal domain-containing protein n=1 Tax=Discostella pseudostelligera TaxID=259834 RepID=A0ABD3MHL7_9STRA